MKTTIKTIVAAIALSFASIATASDDTTTRHHEYAKQAEAKHEFEFKQPKPKVSDEMYKELVAAFDSGDKDAVRFLSAIRKTYNETLKQQGKDEPEDIFVGCLAYQVGGLKALKLIQFDKAAEVINGEKGHTEEEAYAMVDSWNYDQVVIGWKLWKEFGYYGASCWNYEHGGFVAGMPAQTKI